MPRPHVAIRTPRPIVIGEPFEIVVEVTAFERTKVESIDLQLRSVHGWMVGVGTSQTSDRRRHPELSWRLMGAGVLDADTDTRFAQAVQLPHDMPPTHEIAPAYGRTYVRVDVAIPWARDVREELACEVALAPVPAGAPHPASAETAGGAFGLALATADLVPGGVFAGTCRVAGPAPVARALELALVPILTLRGNHDDDRRLGMPIAYEVTLPAGEVAVPFALDIPAALTPAFSVPTHALDWCAAARLADLEVTLPVRVRAA